MASMPAKAMIARLDAGRAIATGLLFEFEDRAGIGLLYTCYASPFCHGDKAVDGKWLERFFGSRGPEYLD